MNVIYIYDCWKTIIIVKTGIKITKGALLTVYNYILKTFFLISTSQGVSLRPILISSICASAIEVNKDSEILNYWFSWFLYIFKTHALRHKIIPAWQLAPNVGHVCVVEIENLVKFDPWLERRSMVNKSTKRWTTEGR